MTLRVATHDAERRATMFAASPRYDFALDDFAQFGFCKIMEGKIMETKAMNPFDQLLLATRDETKK